MVAVLLQALSIKILLYKCGIQNLPDFEDWWCKNKCCCIHQGTTRARCGNWLLPTSDPCSIDCRIPVDLQSAA
jgi:hypothetical protein